MTRSRLEAFSDGVIAIIITIMVLELHAPHGDRLGDLAPLAPVFLSYVLSFVYIGIYWNNHHHLFHTVKNVTGRILWSNLHLLFWLSLLPFVTAWAGENHWSPVPVALYGVDLLMNAVAYTMLTRAIICHDGTQSTLAVAIGRDRKGNLSLALYVAALALSFLSTWIALALYVTVAAIWFVPDTRIERVVGEKGDA